MKKNFISRRSLAIVALSLSATFNAEANILTHGDFEPGTMTSAYQPSTVGVWGLESSQAIVGTSAGVTPIGTRMLQMGQTGGAAAQATQLVSGFFAAGTTVTFEALFNGSAAGTIAGLSFVGRDSLTGADITSTSFAPSWSGLDSDINTWESLSVTGVLDVDVNALRVELVYSTSSLSGGRLGFIDNAVLTATAPSAVPVPAAVWLFGSGLIGLIGVARRKSHS